MGMSQQTMSRDVSKLRVFQTADDLLIQVYLATSTFPVAERYGLQSQLRRAALSIPVNIVEGSARRTIREYVNFLYVATASTAEVAHLLSVARRLELIELERAEGLEHRDDVPRPAPTAYRPRRLLGSEACDLRRSLQHAFRHLVAAHFGRRRDALHLQLELVDVRRPAQGLFV